MILAVQFANAIQLGNRVAAVVKAADGVTLLDSPHGVYVATASAVVEVPHANIVAITRDALPEQSPAPAPPPQAQAPRKVR